MRSEILQQAFKDTAGSVRAVVAGRISLSRGLGIKGKSHRKKKGIQGRLGCFTENQSRNLTETKF